MTLILPLLAFVFASLLVAAAAMMLAPRASAIERRLGEVTGTPLKGTLEEFGYEKKIASALKKIGISDQAIRMMTIDVPKRFFEGA